MVEVLLIVIRILAGMGVYLWLYSRLSREPVVFRGLISSTLAPALAVGTATWWW